MRKFQVAITVCFSAYAMAAGAVGGAGGGGHGGGAGQGGGGHGGGGASHGSVAVKSSPAIGTHIATGGVIRAAQFTVVSQRQATIDGVARTVVTVKLDAPLTNADKDALHFHGFKQGRQYNPGEAEEVYCPSTDLAVERATTCIGFVHRR
jgi:hypothetical protein